MNSDSLLKLLKKPLRWEERVEESKKYRFVAWTSLEMKEDLLRTDFVRSEYPGFVSLCGGKWGWTNIDGERFEFDTEYAALLDAADEMGVEVVNGVAE